MLDDFSLLLIFSVAPCFAKCRCYVTEGLPGYACIKLKLVCAQSLPKRRSRVMRVFHCGNHTKLKAVQ
jgi:hypothetical protein